MENRKYPSKQEEKFLALGYNRFLDLYKEVSSVGFWSKAKEERLLVVKELLSVYVELIKYRPLGFLLSNSKRPHTELVGKHLVGFLRNLLLHFPFYSSWEEIVFDKELITSVETCGKIDQFLTKEHPVDIKYRLWNHKSKEMVYIEVNLQTRYREGMEISLSSIIPEKEGVMLLSLYMYSILMSQVEEISEQEHETGQN
ncbi:MAG: hypothetical protein AAB388_02205 [Patescibacteria group bacterium]